MADNIASAFALVDPEVIRRGQDPPEHPSAPLGSVPIPVEKEKAYSPEKSVKEKPGIS